jgi:transcriptional regulator with XRE-family HTH domain
LTGDPSGTPNPTEVAGLGERIRRFRHEKDMSLSQLAELAGVSKGYLSALENSGRSGQTARRPSGKTLYSIAQTLGVTMSDLLGRRLLTEDPDEPPPESLQRFADERGLPAADLQMLRAIRFRGQQPKTPERWEYIYNAIRASEMFDKEG